MVFSTTSMCSSAFSLEYNLATADETMSQEEPQSLHVSVATANKSVKKNGLTTDSLCKHGTTEAEDTGRLERGQQNNTPATVPSMSYAPDCPYCERELIKTTKKTPPLDCVVENATIVVPTSRVPANGQSRKNPHQQQAPVMKEQPVVEYTQIQHQYKKAVASGLKRSGQRPTPPPHANGLTGKAAHVRPQHHENVANDYDNCAITGDHGVSDIGSSKNSNCGGSQFETETNWLRICVR